MEVTLSYTNPLGKSATFHTRRLSDGSHPPYLLNYITGVGGPAVDYENAPITGSNGSYLGSARYPTRSIQTGCMVYGKTDAERDRRIQNLLGILNPQLGDGTLSYTNHHSEYRASARCKLLPTFGANTKQQYWKPVLIDYECPYPFLRGVAAFSALVAASSAAFVLPFKLPFKLGSQTYRAEANNTSAVPVPVRIIISGPATNPRVINTTTGDSVRVRKSIAAGDKLIISTGPIISVRIVDSQGVESDALNYVDLLHSQWVQLLPGINDLTYSSDDGTKSTRIELHWSDWYLGVG